MRSSKIDKAAPSDRSARKRDEKLEVDTRRGTSDTEQRQTSNKSGKHSSVLKLQASRPELAQGGGAKKVPGAFGGRKRGEKPSAIAQAKDKRV